jgi:hypothetical protein
MNNKHFPKAPPPSGQIQVQEIIQMRLAYNGVPETETTRAILEAFDKVILTFANSLSPNNKDTH